VPQNADLSSDYWKVQTARYIADLKKNGKYEEEVKSFKPAWAKMRQDWQAQVKNADQRKAAADKQLEKLKKDEAAAKDEQEKASIKKKVDLTDLDAAFWRTEKDRLETLLKLKTLDVLERDWQDHEAYAIAGYRLLVNQCNKCHAVGHLSSQQQEGQGPSLNLAAERLRPDWSLRWIANPQRFVPYVSAMPAYFKHGDKTAKGEDAPLVPWLPGPHLEQIGAARDAILNLPRISELPLTRYWMQSGGQ
jgi:mono/diheme cytochrome c family protein